MESDQHIEISLNGETCRVEPGISVKDLLVVFFRRQNGNEADHPRPLGALAVELNNEIVPSNQFSKIIVQAGDSVEVVTLVGGG